MLRNVRLLFGVGSAPAAAEKDGGKYTAQRIVEATAKLASSAVDVSCLLIYQFCKRRIRSSEPVHPDSLRAVAVFCKLHKRMQGISMGCTVGCSILYANYVGQLTVQVMRRLESPRAICDSMAALVQGDLGARGASANPAELLLPLNPTGNSHSCMQYSMSCI